MSATKYSPYDEMALRALRAEARLARAVKVLHEYAHMPQVFGPARAFLASFPQGPPPNPSIRSRSR